MKTLSLILSLAASVITAQAADLTAIHGTMTWTPAHSITNQSGEVRQARTASPSHAFWAAWRTNKPAMRQAGYSARPTDNGWQAIQFVKEAKQ